MNKSLSPKETVNVETKLSGRGVLSCFQNRKTILFLVGAAIATLALISCSTLSTTRTVLVPPQVPGAEYVGSETCAECHAEIVRDFKTATHARLKAEGVNAKRLAANPVTGRAAFTIKVGAHITPS